MVETGATPRKGWRRSTWAVAIGTGLALLVICLTWLRQGDMPGPLVAVAAGWIVLVLPLYDRHRWPARVFLILTALAVILLIWMATTCSVEHMCMVRSFEGAGIVIGWLVVGGLLAFIRFFIFLLDLAHPEPKAGASPHKTAPGSEE